MYIYMYIYIHVYIYAYTCICTCIYTYIYMYMYIYIYIHAYVFTHVYEVYEGVVNVFREARDLCIEGDDNGADLVTEEADCLDDDINSFVFADSTTFTSRGRSIPASTNQASIITYSTHLVGSFVALMSSPNSID